MYNPRDDFVRLPLTNTVNLRDIGGFPGKNGKVTKFHAFLRGGNMSRINQGEVDFLYNYGLRTIIDLRDPMEKKGEDQVFTAEGFHVHDIPFSVGNVMDEDLEDNPHGLFNMYLYILKEYPHIIKKLFSTIATADPGAVLYHCTAGKDRTGIVSAFLLSLAQVSEEDIIANYIISATYNIPYLKTQSMLDKIPAIYLGSEAKTMEDSLRWIGTNFGNPQNYLQEAGITIEEIKAVEERLLGT